jgi:AraC-like DNA-binding protein
MPGVIGALAPYKTQRISEHIDAHLSERCRTDELACVAGLSPSDFSHAFHKRFGLPVQWYVQKQRVALAQGMLATAASLTEIALDCGLGDQSQLCRPFDAGSARHLGRGPGS